MNDIHYYKQRYHDAKLKISSRYQKRIESEKTYAAKLAKEWMPRIHRKIESSIESGLKRCFIANATFPNVPYFNNEVCKILQELGFTIEWNKVWTIISGWDTE